jgi:SAM-dependent methyltransferase
MDGTQDSSQSVLNWVCPRCRHRLVPESGGYRCLSDDLSFTFHDGIWRFLLPERAAYFAPFIEQYETVRRDEGWGSDLAAHYRALPFTDLSGRHRDIWRIRAKSFERLLSAVVAPMVAPMVAPLTAGRERPLKVLDLGSGNGWLSYQLARQEHQVMAVDLLTNTIDGLGAFIHYDTPFTSVQAEFNRLPVDAGQVDLVIYNGALHYSTSYRQTLEEGLRVLRPDGRLVVMDSPIYRDPASGATMVQDRQAQFASRYKFTEQPLPNKGFLTFGQLDELARLLGLQWTYLKPAYGLRWASRHWLARLRRQREPATFLLIVGRRS